MRLKVRDITIRRFNELDSFCASSRSSPDPFPLAPASCIARPIRNGHVRADFQVPFVHHPQRPPARNSCAISSPICPRRHDRRAHVISCCDAIASLCAQYRMLSSACANYYSRNFLAKDGPPCDSQLTLLTVGPRPSWMVGSRWHPQPRWFVTQSTSSQPNARQPPPWVSNHHRWPAPALSRDFERQVPPHLH